MLSLMTEWIKSYVQPSTRIYLQRKMQAPPSQSDRRGYIYALAIEGNRNQLIQYVGISLTLVLDPTAHKSGDGPILKVGREDTLGERVKFWSKHYRGQSVRHLFTGDRAKAMKVPMYKKVERLILMEMEDLMQHKAYLDPNFARARKPPAARAKGWKKPCVKAGCALFYLDAYSG